MGYTLSHERESCILYSKTKPITWKEKKGVWHFLMRYINKMGISGVLFQYVFFCLFKWKFLFSLSFSSSSCFIFSPSSSMNYLPTRLLSLCSPFFYRHRLCRSQMHPIRGSEIWVWPNSPPKMPTLLMVKWMCECVSVWVWPNSALLNMHTQVSINLWMCECVVCEFDQAQRRKCLLCRW